MEFDTRQARLEYASYLRLSYGVRWVSGISLLIMGVMLATMLLNYIESHTHYRTSSYLLYSCHALLCACGVLFSRKHPQPFTHWQPLLIIFTGLFSLTWTAVIYHVSLVSLTLTSAELLAELMIMMSLLGFYASARTTLITVLPVLTISSYITYLSAGESLSLACQQFVITLLVLYTGRKTLYHWFVNSITKEHDKQLLLNQLNKLVSLDQLTGINNRRFFEYELEKQFRASKREKKPLSVIMIDIDFFKLYNDNLGHVQGDVCLKQVAHRLKSSILRPTDSVSRYGGEEFIVLLPGTDLHGAKRVATRIQSQLAEANLSHPHSTVSPRVTVSQGIATMHDDRWSSQLIERADNHLYLAKAQGRNAFYAQ
ncbi:membrane-associated sensor domain-containing protein [Photobacterium japonica]|uniref:sensor domain-containing diguanylate cyclase n=1 Tax=Photobacterium japonica TaxID=2910235 RepID=UPI003D111C08